MTEPAVGLQNGRELRKAFREAGEGITELKQLHRAIADDVAGTARTLVPVRTGRLKSTIRGAGLQTKALVRVGNNRKSLSGVPYAKPIHFGWAARHIKPQPFLYDALDERRQDVIDTYNKEVNDLIKQVARST